MLPSCCSASAADAFSPRRGKLFIDDGVGARRILLLVSTTMPEYTLRILHISDIHFRGARENDRWRRQRVLGDAWSHNLDELLGDGPLDLICLTGDIANTGSPDEYEEASSFVEKLCAKLDLGKDRLFVVPGNHDIDRRVSKSAWRALRRHLSGANPQAVSKWFAGGKGLGLKGIKDSHREEILQRQRAYRDWVYLQLKRPELLPDRSPHGRLGYRATLTLPRHPFPIHVVGLDSAWLCGDEHDAEKLWLTEDQIMRLASDGGQRLPGFRLALIHHPVHSLFDHRSCQDRLAQNVDLLLRGHLHKQDITAELRPDQTLRQLAAGCLYEGSAADAYPNSCHAITVTLDGSGRPRVIDLHLRSFSPEGGHWHDDDSRTPLSSAGRLRWQFANSETGERWESVPLQSRGATALPTESHVLSPHSKADIVGSESLLNGMRTFPAGPQIRKFFANYLGTPEHPEPFGGRADALQLLNDWLNAAAPPCLVVAAPAGCGKSALLCKFCIEVVQRKDLAIIFFPISIRYQTNLESSCIPALVSRLCHLHGEPAPRPDQTTLRQWRLLLDQYLNRPLPDGRTLLLILDGLDEADDWQLDRTLFPARPPSGVRILVAARARTGEVSPDGWRQRLGWSSPAASKGMSLAGLDVNGVAEALRSLGLPLDRLAARSEIVVQLHRLSRGEPLLVRLWCHRLWEQGEQSLRLTPDQLRGYPTGLEGYLQEFWDSRRSTEKDAMRQQAEVRLVLEILAVALGPLLREELLRVAPEIADLAALQDALVPLSRFVLGDGKEQGYVLSHSLLRDYYRDEQMLPDQRLQLEERFLNYGKDTLRALSAGRLAPANVPRYILRNYGSHLKNAGSSPERYLELVDNVWRRAWDQFEGGQGGFLHDVQRAWDAVDLDDAKRVEQGLSPRWMAAMVRCALCIATIQSIQNNVYYRLIERLVELEIWSVRQALTHIQQMSNEQGIGSTRDTLFAFLLPRLPDDLVPQALDIAVTFANEKRGSHTSLIAMSKRLADVCPHEAVAAARGLHSEHARSLVLAALARHLPAPSSASLFAEILTTARAHANPGVRSYWLQSLAEFFPEEKQPSVLLESLGCIVQIEDAHQRASNLRELIPRLPNQQRDAALDMLFDAACHSEREHSLLAAMEVLDGFPSQTQERIVHKILEHPRGPTAIVHWIQRPHQAVGTPEGLSSVTDRWKHLKSIVNKDSFDRLVGSQLDRLADPLAAGSLDCLQDLAPLLSSSDLSRAVELLRCAAEPWLPARGLCLLAPYVPVPVALEGLSRLLNLAWSRDFSGHRELRAVFSALPEDHFSIAVDMVAAAVSPLGKAWGAAFALSKHQQGPLRPSLLALARASAQAIHGPQARASMLMEILSQYSAEEQWELIGHCVQAIRDISSGYHRINQYIAFAPRLIQPWCDHLLRAALDEMPTLEKNYRAAAVLSHILTTPGISAELKTEVLAEALHTAREQGGARETELSLTDLSDHAPPEQRDALLLEALAASRRLDGLEQGIITAVAMHPDEVIQERLLRRCGELKAESLHRLLYFYLWENLSESLYPEAARMGLRAARTMDKDDLQSWSTSICWLERSPLAERPALVQEALTGARNLLEAHRGTLGDDAKANADEVDAQKYHALVNTMQNGLPILGRELSAADALSLAEIIPATWWSCHAALAQRIEEPRRSELLHQRLEHARTQPETSRGLAIAELVIHLPLDKRRAGIEEALQQACIIWQSANTYWDNRAKVMKCVAAHLEAVHLPRFLELLLALYSTERPFMGLAALIELLPASLVPSVLEALLERLEHLSAHIQERILAACASRLSVEYHERLVQLLPRLWDPNSGRSLAALVPQLSDRLLRRGLACTLEANQDLPPTDAQLHAWACLASEGLRRRSNTLREIYLQTLFLLKQRSLDFGNYHLALQHLAPLLRQLVGQEGVNDVAETLLDVSTWWR